MTYFKNVDLASKYNISEATVRNWVKTTKEGKLNLTLHEEKGRTYVANVPSNIRVIEKLVSENKKYRNSKAAKTVTPKPEFYKLFDQNQIYDIVRNLEIHHEIPLQYNYFDGAADEWDEYVHQLSDRPEPNFLNQTIQLLDDNESYINNYVTQYESINIIDIGAGNSLPVKEFLEKLINIGVLGRYIAIDISPQMLDIAEANIKKWFGDKINFERYQIDITKEQFANLLAKDYLSKKANSTANMMLFFGGTSGNLRTPDDAFRIINESMNPNDIMLMIKRLTSSNMLPEWFTHLAPAGKPKVLKRHRLVFDMLNIDESFFDVEVGFDQELGQQYTKCKLKIALLLKFEFEDGQRIVELSKGDSILLWRSWKLDASDIHKQLNKNGFYTLHSSQTKDHNYIFTASEAKA